MKLEEAESLIEYFGDIEDPRQDRGKRHKLVDIICIAILAVICDANDYEEVEAYGLSKEAWLSSFLELPHGIPSDATFRRVFGALRPEKWQSCFMQWVKSIELPTLSESKDHVLALDGKTACGSDRDGLKGLHTVSVWSSQHGIVIGQQQTDTKSNEITVLPSLIESVAVKGNVITTDAMGTQTQVAWAVREHKADYMLALKENHPKLYKDVVWLFEHAHSLNWINIEHDFFETYDKQHGREEHRKYWTISDLSVLEEKVTESWKDLQSFTCVESICISKGKTTTERRYFISSLPCDAKRAAHAIRNHWSIENSLHWVLDVAFDEDKNMVHLGHGQANWVTLRHIALNLLKLDKSIKASIKVKRKRAGWDNDYLLSLLHS